MIYDDSRSNVGLMQSSVVNGRFCVHSFSEAASFRNMPIFRRIRRCWNASGHYEPTVHYFRLLFFKIIPASNNAQYLPLLIISFQFRTENCDIVSQEVNWKSFHLSHRMCVPFRKFMFFFHSYAIYMQYFVVVVVAAI